LESGAVQIAGHGHYFERVLGDMENLPIEDESVDCCLFFATLHHSHDLNLAFSEAARVLRPGGTVLAIHEGVSGILRNNKIVGIRSVHEVDWQEYDWNEQTFALHTYIRAAKAAGLTCQPILPPFIEHRLKKRKFDGLLFGRIAALAARIWRLPGGRALLRSRASVVAASYLVGMPLTAIFRKSAPAGNGNGRRMDEMPTDSDEALAASARVERQS
jgi:SAM-dependent methyltransferase